MFPSSSQEGSKLMNPGPNPRERGRCTAAALGQPREVMDDFSLCFEESLISPSVLPGGFSTSLLQLASPWGLGHTFGDSEGLAGAAGGGEQALLSKQDLANHILSPTAAGRGGCALHARWPCRYGPQPRRRCVGCGWGRRGGHTHDTTAGGPWPEFCCPSWGCRQPARSPSSPRRSSRPRCSRADPRRASRRRPSKADLNASKKPGGARSPLQLLFVPQAASCPELLLSHIVFLSRWGRGLPAARPPGLPPPPACQPRRRLQLAGGEATFVCQPVRPPPPARAISGNSS